MNYVCRLWDGLQLLDVNLRSNRLLYVKFVKVGTSVAEAVIQAEGRLLEDHWRDHERHCKEAWRMPAKLASKTQPPTCAECL